MHKTVAAKVQLPFLFKRLCAIRRHALILALAISAAQASFATETNSARLYLDCSAYFFMAANAQPMQEFDDYYRSGEFAYNRALTLVGERQAIERFNQATHELNVLIDKTWSAFNKADQRYGVVCADIFRDAIHPDRR